MPGSIKIEAKPGTTYKQKRLNIEKFLEAAHDYGIPREKIFPVEDLLYFQHLPRVSKSIFALGKLVGRNIHSIHLLLCICIRSRTKIADYFPFQVDADGEYTGPKLGPEPFEAAGRCMRRGGLPIGDDISVAHVNTKWLRQRLPGVPTSS